MNPYPLKEVVRTKLDERRMRVKDLLSAIDKSERWWQGIDAIEKLQLEVIMQISSAIDYDILIDFYQYKGRGEAMQNFAAMEPEVKYSANEKIDELQITIRGSAGLLKGKVEKLIEGINKAK